MVATLRSTDSCISSCLWVGLVILLAILLGNIRFSLNIIIRWGRNYTNNSYCHLQSQHIVPFWLQAAALYIVLPFISWFYPSPRYVRSTLHRIIQWNKHKNTLHISPLWYMSPLITLFVVSPYLFANTFHVMFELTAGLMNPSTLIQVLMAWPQSQENNFETMKYLLCSLDSKM